MSEDSVKGKKCEPGVMIKYVEESGYRRRALILERHALDSYTVDLFIFSSTPHELCNVPHDQRTKLPGTWHW